MNKKVVAILLAFVMLASVVACGAEDRGHFLHGKAIDEIDKTIDHLQKIKENLQKTDNNLRLANNKAEDLTVKKLTYNNPTMKKMFDELKTIDKKENINS